MINFNENYLLVNHSHKLKTTHYDEALTRYIGTLVALKEKQSLLDLGCGTGIFVSLFSEVYNTQCHGVDIDYEDKKRNIIKLDIGSKKLPYDDRSFDVIFSKMLIEHLSLGEIAFMLRECKRVLKPGGKIIFITPDWRWMYKIFYQSYTHQTPFTYESLATALKMAGFECLYSKSFIQIPFLWNRPYLKFFSNFASLFYPITKKKIKFIKFSYERALICCGSHGGSE
jgi:ubiquinone/menaquinone biosynthesis C-methylase UbiE